MKKRFTFAAMLGIMGVFAGFTVNGAEDAVKGASAPIVVPSQYVAIAKLLVKSKGDTTKLIEVAKESVKHVVEKGKTYEEKRILLGEIATTLLASIVDWSEADRIAIAKAIAEATLELAPAGAEQLGFVKEAFASMAVASLDTVPVVSAVKDLPEALQADATDAVLEPMSVLGGTVAWGYNDLYDAVRDALGADPNETRPGDVFVVAVSTTTTTTSSTSTTTTTRPGTGIIVTTTRPHQDLLPTTKPSPTPVGLR